MVIEILKECGALLEGHFLLSSGRHSKRYVQCAKLLTYPDKAEKVLRASVEKLEGIEFDVVVGPAMGGVIVAYEIGRQTGKPAMFTEREEGTVKFRRGFEIKPGQRILIAEDVVTTGKSSLEVIELIKSLGGEVVGIACIVDRKSSNLGLPIFSATELTIESFLPEECPLCKEGLPYVKPGSRVQK